MPDCNVVVLYIYMYVLLQSTAVRTTINVFSTFHLICLSILGEIKFASESIYILQVLFKYDNVKSKCQMPIHISLMLQDLDFIPTD